jgi:hypothetical protein
MIIELRYKSGQKEEIEIRETNFGVIVLEKEGEADRMFVHLDDHEVKAFRPNHVFVEVGFVVAKAITHSNSPETA